ncbi:MAG: hypothetical protein ACK5LR_04830 [Mangrovibacterium sp.]
MINFLLEYVLFSLVGNVVLWSLLLGILAFAYFSKASWLTNYAVYVLILFFMQTPVLIPFFIDGVVKKVLPFVRGYSEVAPWLLFFTVPAGLLALLIWTGKIIWENLK